MVEARPKTDIDSKFTTIVNLKSTIWFQVNNNGKPGLYYWLFKMILKTIKFQSSVVNCVSIYCVCINVEHISSETPPGPNLNNCTKFTPESGEAVKVMQKNHGHRHPPCGTTECHKAAYQKPISHFCYVPTLIHPRFIYAMVVYKFPPTPRYLWDT